MTTPVKLHYKTGAYIRFGRSLVTRKKDCLNLVARLSYAIYSELCVVCDHEVCMGESSRASTSVMFAQPYGG
jgi:hypothetical protein